MDQQDQCTASLYFSPAMCASLYVHAIMMCEVCIDNTYDKTVLEVGNGGNEARQGKPLGDFLKTSK